MLGGFPLKVEVESVHWEDQNSGYSFLAAADSLRSTSILSPSSLGTGTILSSPLVNGAIISPSPLGGRMRGICEYEDRARPQPLSRLISPVTQRWLSENYEVSEGCSVPRNVIYEHYLDFCVRNSVQPVNAASFGKIIRQHFPTLKTRRLGSRGQSKYHYYGLAIKETSQYHMNDYTYSSPARTQPLKSNIVSPVKPVPADVLASLLPDFPKSDVLKIPKQAKIAHITTFLEQYRIYSHNVLEVIVKAAFSEVEPLLMKFWGSFSDEVLSSLNLFSDVVAYCDILLSKTIISLLLPTPLHPIPSSLTQTIRSFCKQYGGWTRMAVAGLPGNIVQAVLQASDIFVAMMRRQTTLTHIAQATRTVLSSSSAVSQMIHDWCHLDIDSMTHQAMFLFTSPEGDMSSGTLKRIQSEFSELLGEQASVEEYAEWIKELIDKFVVKSDSEETFKNHAQKFVSQWSYFISRIVRDLTLRSAPSFGSFHLLHMLFSDYVLHLVEEHQQSALQAELWASLTGEKCQPTFPSVAAEHQTSTNQHIPTSHSKGTSSPQNLAPSQQNMMSSQQNMAPLCQSNGTLIQPRINNIDKTSLSPGHETEISVVDDYVEVTSQPLEIVTSSNDVMMTSPEDMIMSHIMGNPLDETEDINMEGNASMLSSSHNSIFSLSNGLTIGRTANRNIMLQNTSSDILTTQDIILNEGDTLSENLMEEILKCVSNSNI
ncbi:regulatory factor X 4-like isoform X2 [Bolinopsis microptera]|uniref:regulatory factor X 4-like isoform X2 n=1 Tax=Bolinopsis microptera TaxID=2820187 RepID=UPI00307AE094